MKILEPNTYLDLAKLPSLIELIEEFCSQPISAYQLDVGVRIHGVSINYFTIPVYDLTGEFVISDDLEPLARPIIAYSRNIADVERIFINFLNPNSSIPNHLGDPTLPEYNGEDVVSVNYNVVVPVNTHGFHVVDNTTLVSVKGSPIIFNDQVYRSTINNSNQTHIWITMIIDPSRFIVP